jgi:hypothetical protein
MEVFELRVDIPYAVSWIWIRKGVSDWMDRGKMFLFRKMMIFVRVLYIHPWNSLVPMLL